MDEYFKDLFCNAEKFGLQEEVVYSALKAMKGNPSLSINEAMEIGCLEWDIN